MNVSLGSGQRLRCPSHALLGVVGGWVPTPRWEVERLLMLMLVLRGSRAVNYPSIQLLGS